MNNDFKKSSYLLTIIFFLVGIAALVGVSAAKYFQFDELVVSVSQIISLLAFFAMCIRFADYILTNRRKEAERRSADAERMQEMQNIRAAAERDREKAVAAALQQGRSEGAQSSGAMAAEQRAVPFPMPQSMPAQPNMPAPVQPSAPTQQTMPVTPQQPVPAPVQQPAPAPAQQQRMPEPQRAVPARREPVEQPNEEVLYNEYGEPVMMRRRVRKTPYSPDGEMLYDSNGNPVIRRNQGLWEPLEQRHEIVFKFETSPGVTVSQSDRREGGQ